MHENHCKNRLSHTGKDDNRRASIRDGSTILAVVGLGVKTFAVTGRTNFLIIIAWFLRC